MFTSSYNHLLLASVDFEELCCKFRQTPTLKDFLLSDIYETPNGGKGDVANQSSLVVCDTSADESENEDLRRVVEELLKCVSNPSVEFCIDKKAEEISIEKICLDHKLIVSDNTFLSVCRAFVSCCARDSALLGKFLILPKLYHQTNDFPSVVEKELESCCVYKSQIFISSVIEPFLSMCNEILECHKNIFFCVFKETPKSSIGLLLSIMSKHTNINDVHIQVMQAAVNETQLGDEQAYSCILSMLSKTHIKTSVKYGKCLLHLLQKHGTALKYRESIAALIQDHKSVMKKALEIEFRKFCSHE